MGPVKAYGKLLYIIVTVNNLWICSFLQYLEYLMTYSLSFQRTETIFYDLPQLKQMRFDK